MIDFHYLHKVRYIKDDWWNFIKLLDSEKLYERAILIIPRQTILAQNSNGLLGGISWKRPKQESVILVYFVMDKRVQKTMLGARVAKKLIDMFETWCRLNLVTFYYGEIAKDNIGFQKLAEHYGAKRYRETEKDYLYHKELP